MVSQRLKSAICFYLVFDWKMVFGVCFNVFNHYHFSPDLHLRLMEIARLAQSVERLTLNQVVEGSSPSVGDLFY